MSERAPKVTVIIPAYNRAAFLRDTIDAALGQTWSPLEVVVVDDGSTDETPEILASYGDRIRVLRHPNGANAGTSVSVNLGLSEADKCD